MDQGKRICCEVNSLFCYILYRFKKISTFSGCRIQGILCPEFLYCYFYSMKDFLVLGRCTAMGYKGINDCILEGKIWFGCTETGKMIGGDVHCYWFSNLVSDKKVEFIPLTRKYNEGDYRKMDFYDAINIDSIYDIPDDYDGVMAVPVTFLNRWCKDQFEVLDARDYTDDVRLKKMDTKIINTGSYVDGVSKFTRILIKKK